MVLDLPCLRSHRNLDELCCIYLAAAQALYQGEHLVDILVNTRAHNYLEFKAVEGR